MRCFMSPNAVNDDVRTTEGATCIGPSTTTPHFPTGSVTPRDAIPQCGSVGYGQLEKAFEREL